MNDFEIEYPSCNLCNSFKTKLLFEDGRETGKGIVRCLDCGLIYRNIRSNKDSLRNYYEKKQFNLLSPEWIEGRINVFRPYLGMLSKFRKLNRILDVGAGYGLFLAACKEDGWDCYGTEHSVQGRSYSEKEFGIQLSCLDIENMAYTDQFFDVVSFWNVLDHLSDPKSALLSAYRLLRPGGIVLIRCLNGSFHVSMKQFFQILGKLFPGIVAIKLPVVFHPFSFNRQTLMNMIGLAGFVDIIIGPAHLSWTTLPDDELTWLRSFAAKSMGGFSSALYNLTRQRVVISPSIMGFGMKK